MAKMAGGRADDLASTLLLATDKRVLIAPAMNVRMWDHPATRRNLAVLQGDGVLTVGPEAGEMACGEFGPGRMAEPEAIVAAIAAALGGGPLAGRHVLVTSGPTHEPIDPVRYIANRSSGAQGAALAAALRDLGARVTFVTGPAAVPPASGRDGRAGGDGARDARRGRGGAARRGGGDGGGGGRLARGQCGRAEDEEGRSGRPPALEFAENPDILATVSKGPMRPRLVVGFAAETEHVVDHAMAKRARKGCDWIVANDVSPATGIMGGAENAVVLISDAGAEAWPRMGKDAVARRLAQRIAEALG